jgi:Kef-type K+ transport system membrane component KefB
MNALGVVVLFGLMHSLRSFSTEGVASGIGTSVALGYLLLTGLFVGRMFARVRLPKLTGYIATGLVVGPAALGVVNDGMVESLKIVNGMAVALIALTAGTELELRAMRPLFRSIRWITLIGVIGTALLLAIAVVLVRSRLSFLDGRPPRELFAIAAVLGVVMVAQSPAVVVALKNELQADGPVARTVLGVVVIADLVVILLFAIASSVTKVALGAKADVWTTLGSLAWELVGSLVVGAALGALLALYVEKVRGGAGLFLLTLAFIIAEVGQRLFFDPLLLALGAGILIRNATSSGDVVHRHIEASSLPVYILFFAVAGTTLHFDMLAKVGIPAAIFVLVRGTGLWTGASIGAWIAGAPELVRRYAGVGLLPQAGLAIALSTLFARTFPEFGADAGALTLSVVAINEILAPALYRVALVRSGEAGKRAPAGLTDPHGVTVSGPIERAPGPDDVVPPEVTRA